MGRDLWSRLYGPLAEGRLRLARPPEQCAILDEAEDVGVLFDPCRLRPALRARSGPGPGHSLPAQEQMSGRPGMGHNGGPPLKDNLPLRAIFPALAAASGGQVAMTIAAIGTLTNPLGPAASLSLSMDRHETRRLLDEIQALDPDFRYQSLGKPLTPQGRANEMQALRWDLAVAAYRVRGDHSHLQAETVRLLQRKVDARYAEADLKFRRGELAPRLSREEAIGNYIDRHVRRDLRDQYTRLRIPTTKGGSVRINAREYDSSGSDLTFRIPDARVGSLAIDMTLTRKTLATPQIRGFFNADFLPEAVIIVRPSQVGEGSTYIIPRPRS